jgi:4-diphosphocytidyl-2-C-methyl-D-erythritol kinase
MISFPDCKINLGLNVTGKRPDGFHDLESVFLHVPLNDVLEIIEDPAPEKGRDWSFECSGLPVPADASQNLVVRAYLLLKAKFALPAVKIYLHKVIPMGAGLGGGSSDAAFMLKLLMQKFNLAIGEAELTGFAATLGSDCPFFLQSETAYVTGRGEKIELFQLNLSGYHLAIVNPRIHIATATAFNLIKPQQRKESLRKVLSEPVDNWKDRLVNDFEIPVMEIYPEIKSIKEKLFNMGAAYVSMTGTGSSVYGIFDGDVDLTLFDKQYFVWKGPL